MIRILLADEHALSRAALRALVEPLPDIEIVAELDDASALTQKAPAVDANVLVLDPTLKGALSALKALRVQGASLRSLVLTRRTDRPFLRTLLAAGADGYVTWGAAPDALFNAMRAVHRGRSVVELPVDPEDLPVEPPSALSPRETEVLRRVALGFTHREVAEHLSVSVKSVETYRARISDKLGLKTRADLVRYALEMDLIDLAG